MLPLFSGKMKRAAAIFFPVLFAYSIVLTGDFVLDDHVLVEKNAFIKELKAPHLYFAQEDGVPDRSQWQTDEYHTGYYRPLVSLSYALDHWIHGNNPVGFRLTNLLLHLAVCLSLLAFLRRHVADGIFTLAAVLVFALHPVNTEAVAWISSRNNIMAALFSVLALDFYARRGGYSLLLSVLFFALALFSKEYGVMLLPMLFAWNRTLGAGQRDVKQETVSYLPFGAVLVGYFILRASVTGSVLSPAEGAGFWLRLAMVPYLVLYNLRLILLPAGLHSFSVDYPEKGTWAPIILGLVGLALVSVLIWRYRHDKRLLMGTACFLLGLFPVLHIVPTSAVSLISMRWLYFPLAFFTIAWCRPLSFLLRKPLTAGVLVAAILALGGYSAYLNRFQWHDDTVFFQREVVEFGNMAYAGGMADVLHGRGQYQEAEFYYLKGIEARPNMVETRISYAALLTDTGRPEQALAVLDQVDGWAMSSLNRGRLCNNQGVAMMRLKKISDAIALLEKAVALAPDEPTCWGNLGSAYGRIGDYVRSSQAFERGLSLAPQSVGLLSGLVLTRLNMKDFQGAAQAFERLPKAEREKRADLAERIRSGLSK